MNGPSMFHYIPSTPPSRQIIVTPRRDLTGIVVYIWGIPKYPKNTNKICGNTLKYLEIQ
jgi:hypothetical protein